MFQTDDGMCVKAWQKPGEACMRVCHIGDGSCVRESGANISSPVIA